MCALSCLSSFPPSNPLLSVPPNCRFEVDDAEDDWTYNLSFDYIHGRMLVSCFNNDFPALVAKAYAALNPGGWFELQDMLPPTCFDDSWEGSNIKRWVESTIAGAKALGMDWHKVGKYKEWTEAAGFENVTEFKGAWPTNMWPRDKHYKLLGAWQNQVINVRVHLLDCGLIELEYVGRSAWYQRCRFDTWTRNDCAGSGSPSCGCAARYV